MSDHPDGRSSPRFITDRMLGPLCRYLRLMGYDTLDVNRFPAGNPREDSDILRIAREECRVILTCDRDLARRGSGSAFLIVDGDIMDQVSTLCGTGLIIPHLALDRCPLCNSLVRPAHPNEIRSAPYAPENIPESGFTWCESCSRLYWVGGHCARMKDRLSVQRNGL